MSAEPEPQVLEEVIPCPRCGGLKELEVWVVDPAGIKLCHHIACFSCRGRGTVTPERAAYVQEMLILRNRVICFDGGVKALGRRFGYKELGGLAAVELVSSSIGSRR